MNNPTTLRYQIVTEQTFTEEVEGLRVTARFLSDDGHIHSTFDCTEALIPLSKIEMYDLLIEGWPGYKSDRLAHFFTDSRTNAYYYYVDSVGVGYSVIPNAKELKMWLEQERTEWFEEWSTDEDIQANLK